MKKVNIKYDLIKLRNEVQILLKDHKLVNDSQLLLQSITGNDWYTTIAPYKVKDNLREWHYKIPNTPDDWEITRFMVDNNICRTRLMKLKPKECYYWHKDVGYRMHIAIWSNDKCFFVENEKLLNIPADGYPYVVDVNNNHTAMNCSQEDRYHLVGCIRE